MLKIILFSLILLVIIPPAFAQISEKTGLQQDFTIETGGYDFSVSTISSFNIGSVEFSSDEKRLTLFFETGIENNLSEIQIPTNLINGNFTFFLNNQEIFPSVRMNEKISFITLEFEGKGTHKLDIIGTTYLPEFAQITPLILVISLLGIIFLFRMKKSGTYSLIKD